MERGLECFEKCLSEEGENFSGRFYNLRSFVSSVAKILDGRISMTKGVFVVEKLNSEKLRRIEELGADTIFIAHKNLEADVLEEARKVGFKVYAEVTLFAGKELWETYPDSRPIDSGGNLIKMEEWYAGVCPNNPNVRELKLREIEEVVKKFDIDGIWLDFIRYPCHWEVKEPNLMETCFCKYCLDKFEEENEEPFSPSLRDVWIQWKCEKITEFVAEVSGITKDQRKILGLFGVPWKESDFGGAIKSVIGQDFEKLAEYVDIFSPMTYHKMCHRSASWVSDHVAYLSELTQKPILPLVQTEDKPSKLSAEEFESSVYEALKLSSEGVIIFFLEDLLEAGGKVGAVKEAFSG